MCNRKWREMFRQGLEFIAANALPSGDRHG